MAKQAGVSRQERLAQLVDKIKKTDTGSSGNAGFWSPKEGRTTIRIMPESYKGKAIGDMTYFFQTVGRHNFPPDGKKSCYCPNFTSEGELPCPICEMVDDLYKSGDKSNKDMASKLRARKMYWMNIVVRGKVDPKTHNADPDTGPFIYTPGVTVFTQIAALISDPDYGDVMDVEDGIDLTIERTGTGLDTEYQITPRRNSSALGTDEQVEKWFADARDLTYVEVTDDPEDDKKIASGHAIYVLPYDRIIREFDLDADGDIDDDVEEEEVAKTPASKAREYKAPAEKAKAADPEDEEEEEYEDAEEEEEEAPPPPKKAKAPVSSPAKEEVQRRVARRSLR